MTKQEYDELLQDAVISRLEQGVNPWQVPWTCDFQHNGVTRRAYRGMNALFLGIVSDRFYDNDPRWYTYDQAKKLGLQVKRGSKATPAYLFSDSYRRTLKDENGKPLLDKNDSPSELVPLSPPAATKPARVNSLYSPSTMMVDPTKLSYEEIRLFRANEDEMEEYQVAIQKQINVLVMKQKSAPWQSRFDIPVCSTPFVLRELGVPSGRIVMRPNVVGKVIGVGENAKHDIPIEVLEDLPRQLCNPVAVAHSSTRPHDSLVILTHHLIDDMPVVAIFQIDIGTKVSEHMITSIYERNSGDIDFLRRWLEEGKVVYAQKKDLVRVAFRPACGAGYNSRWRPSKSLLGNIPTKALLVNNYRRHNRYTIFIAGQRPEDDRNKHTYALAEKRLTERGYRVVNPAATPDVPPFELMKRCNAVALLPGQRSLVAGFTVQDLSAALNIKVVKDFEKFFPRHILERQNQPVRSEESPRPGRRR